MPPIDSKRMSRAGKFNYDVGTRIRNLRESANMSQMYLSDKADMSQSQLSRIEDGERAITLQQAKAVARVFNVTLEALASPLIKQKAA